MKRLVLFDIDGTLITDRGAARDAYASALRAVYDFSDPLSRYDFSGLTDPQITHMVLGDAGFRTESIEERIGALWEHYLARLAENATPERVRLLPGAGELVDRLAHRDDVLLALLTGNIERGARLKLAPPDLNRYFPFGAFGSDSSRREDLPPVAIDRASRRNGHRFSGSDVVIIGDSIFDVRCGVPHGATTIAVASGRTAHDLLRLEKPTHLFHTLEDTEALLAAIMG
jgi:phosphoglycolate phosphatase-like HAD superfamily hydrolase